jgi:hypothetical protein
MGRCKLPQDTTMTVAQWQQYFAEHPDEVSTPEESYADMYGIGVEMISRHKQLCNMKMSLWPEGLYEYVVAFTQCHGACGEVICAAIGKWMMGDSEFGQAATSQNF